jgi:hypothetical protein
MGVASITGKISVKNLTAEQAAYVFGLGLGPTGYIASLLADLANGNLDKVQSDVLDLLSSSKVAKTAAGTPLAKVAANLAAQIAAHRATANENVKVPANEHVQASEPVQVMVNPEAWSVFVELAGHFEGITPGMVATAYINYGDPSAMPTLNSAFDALCAADTRSSGTANLDPVHHLASLRDGPAGTATVTSEPAISG